MAHKFHKTSNEKVEIHSHDLMLSGDLNANVTGGSVKLTIHKSVSISKMFYNLIEKHVNTRIDLLVLEIKSREDEEGRSCVEYVEIY